MASEITRRRGGLGRLAGGFIGLALLSIMFSACSRSDASIQADLQRQLDTDPVTSPVHLAATVKEGVAQISGTTETMTQQTRALDIAGAVKGVKRTEATMRLNDAALKQALLKAIAADPSVSGVPLTIDVTDGLVELKSDQTNADQRTTLMTIARGVGGATRVEDLMK